jgi:hypothetical protein
VEGRGEKINCTIHANAGWARARGKNGGKGDCTLSYAHSSRVVHKFLVAALPRLLRPPQQRLNFSRRG